MGEHTPLNASRDCFKHCGIKLTLRVTFFHIELFHVGHVIADGGVGFNGVYFELIPREKN